MLWILFLRLKTIVLKEREKTDKYVDLAKKMSKLRNISEDQKVGVLKKLA